ncbi:hypothetical protein P280DRAFT_514298 [Massarina eburnea CBS 473.64]|uniref:Uncharacterized protein n=1 Tax=Massarina eburnea CBS 473.64 TaxID=1395130 RepID=A0A6A6SDP2_9PLEO|nr:hypothetical protein P280DRAFT_514298 [Massarina eburnea CBS 473.64]
MESVWSRLESVADMDAVDRPTPFSLVTTHASAALAAPAAPPHPLSARPLLRHPPVSAAETTSRAPLTPALPGELTEPETASEPASQRARDPPLDRQDP